MGAGVCMLPTPLNCQAAPCILRVLWCTLAPDLGAATVLCTDTKHECCYLQSLMVLGEGKAEAEKLLS